MDGLHVYYATWSGGHAIVLAVDHEQARDLIEVDAGHEVDIEMIWQGGQPRVVFVEGETDD